MPESKSVGHVVFHNGFEFLHGPDGTLYRAPVDRPIDLEGYRQGARFECMPRQDGHKWHLKACWGVEL